MTPTGQDERLRDEIDERLETLLGYLGYRDDRDNWWGFDTNVGTLEDEIEGTLDSIIKLITADRKRVALEAKAKVITDLELFIAQEASTYMNSKYTVHQHQKDYSDGIADGKNNAYSRLAQWLNRLKAQQEEV